MTVQAILGEGLQGGRFLMGKCKGGQAVDGIDAHLGFQVRLGAESITYLSNRAGVSGLDAGDHALDVISLLLWRTAVTGIAATGCLDDLQG